MIVNNKKYLLETILDIYEDYIHVKFDISVSNGIVSDTLIYTNLPKELFLDFKVQQGLRIKYSIEIDGNGDKFQRVSTVGWEVRI